MTQNSPTPAFNGAALTEPLSLWHRVNAGDVKGTKEILEAFPHIGQIHVRTTKNYVQGDQAIHIAARMGTAESLEIIDLLIAHGAKIDDRNDMTDETPLLATIGSTVGMPSVLINERGADADARDSTGGNAMHVAARNGWTFTVEKLLLEEKINTNATDAKGNSPLMLAVAEQHDNTIRRLLENGARVDIKNNDGLTAVDIAQKTLSPEMRALVKRAHETGTQAQSKAAASKVSWHIRHGAGRALSHPKTARFTPKNRLSG